MAQISRKGSRKQETDQAESEAEGMAMQEPAPESESDSDAERRRRIAEAAYYRAEQRNFAPGNDMEDWLEAERQLHTAEHEA